MKTGLAKSGAFVSVALLALVTGCAGAAPPATVTPSPALEQHRLLVDYSGLYEHAFTESLYDSVVVQPGLMQRVLVEPDLLTQQVHVETWAAVQLLSWMGKHGSLIIGPPLPPELEVRAPCRTGGCFETPPTAVLRNVRFVSGTDQVDVAVVKTEAGVKVAIRRVVEEKSLCAEDYKLPLGHVQLRMMVQRMSDGALAGLLQETRLLSTPAKPAVEADLPTYESSPEAFCQAVASVFENTPELGNTDWQYMVTAQLLLDSVLTPLYVKSEPAVPSGEG